MAASPTDPWQWRERLLAEMALAPAVESVPLRRAAGRLLAQSLHSPEDIPSGPVSAMDGFAVRSQELTGQGSTILPVSADLPARPGQVPPLARGTAARIMTGAPMPEGADLVIPVEDTDADPEGRAPARVRIAAEASREPGRHLRSRGEEIGRGDVLAEAGDRIGPGLIGLARTLGIAQVPVRAPLRIAVVVTGDELTADDAHQAEGTVRESNGTMLAAALTADGCEARVLRSGDEPAALAEVLADAEESADLVLTTGGIGHGAYDVVKALLGPRGTGTSCFVHLALRPGGPQGAGRLPGGTPVVHLPGTPVGALVGHHLFVRQLLPGGGSPPHAVGLEDPTGLVARSRRREGLVVLAGRLATGPQGAPLVRLLPGRRLAPYGRADALVLGGAAACTGIEDSALVMPL